MNNLLGAAGGPQLGGGSRVVCLGVEVLAEVALGLEGDIADVAVVRPEIGVGAQVLPQNARLLAAHSARCTHVPIHDKSSSSSSSSPYQGFVVRPFAKRT